jgi:hypothetical protein
MYENNVIPHRDNNSPAHSYYASRQSGEDARGVPLALQKQSLYPENARVFDAGNGNSVRYVIERLCNNAGPATAANCNLVSVSAATVPAFRITVRVDGPQNTVSHVQMMLRDSAPPLRLSWRILGE